MTSTLCDRVTERVALGDELAELSEHAQTCQRCQRLIAMPSQLGHTRHAVDPGLGFSARMTVGAQHRLAVRRRRRVAVGLAATVASGVFGVVLVTRSPETAVGPLTATELRNSVYVDAALESPGEPSDEPAIPVDDDEVAALVELADVDKAMQVSVQWPQIEKPLARYKKLLDELDAVEVAP